VCVCFGVTINILSSRSFRSAELNERRRADSRSESYSVFRKTKEITSLKVITEPVKTLFV
jgi:hypothetical protein